MTNYKEIVDRCCEKHGLREDIVMAICAVESNYDTYAMRYELHWRYHFNVEYYASINKITKDTEHQLQSFSYGVMQVMGSVARELGFQGPLVKVCVPDIGIDLGCKKLKQQLVRYDGEYDKAISAYNQGTAYRELNGDFRNQNYVNKVMEKVDGKV
jgi:soluble lytic murein transglycosylase-like protein